MPAAVTIVAGAMSLAVAYGQLLSRPDDLALACTASTAMYLMVHYAAQAMGSSSSGGDEGSVEDAEREPWEARGSIHGAGPLRPRTR